LRLSEIKCEPFVATLERVISIMKSIKTRFPGIKSALACELMSSMGFREVLKMNKKEWERSLTSGRSSPMLTNLGVISPSPLLFGETVIKTLTW